jgi:methyl-accepting chemotaxis protein
MAKSSISAMTDIVNGINTNIQELSRRSESTNENVVFIADIFEYLANLAGPIINFGKSFGISMQQVINSAVNAINPLS